MNDEKELDYEIYDINEIHESEFGKKAYAIFDRLDQLLNKETDDD